MQFEISDWVSTARHPNVMRRDDLFRAARDCAAAALEKSRGQDVFSLGVATWKMETEQVDSGLALGSMERVDIAERLTTLFCLRDHGYEDYLLSGKVIGDWVGLIALSLGETGERLTFMSSGSTGKPKPTVHSLDHLLEEVTVWRDLFKGCRRIVSAVPAHHIYGFIWTVLLPAALDVPVLDYRLKTPGTIAHALEEGDLVVAVPSQWEAICQHERNLSGVRGVNAAGPLKPDVWSALSSSNLTLIDVYGASELGAVGWRSEQLAPYRLLDHWSVSDDGLQVVRHGSCEPVSLPDHIDSHADGRSFELLKRRDGWVSIHGKNVDPEMVRLAFLGVEGVEDCAVRLESDGNALKLYVSTQVLAADQSALEARLRDHAVSHLPSEARPGPVTFGPSIPRDALGKLTDW